MENVSTGIAETELPLKLYKTFDDHPAFLKRSFYYLSESGELEKTIRGNLKGIGYEF
jgi:hypothetical protein